MVPSQRVEAITTPRRPLPFRGRFYYGWVQLAALSWTELISWGIVYYAFSALIVPMSADLGWSRIDLTGAFSLGVLVSGIAGIPIGRHIDRHGARGVMTAGSLAASLLLVAWAAIDSLAMFYLLWMGFGVTMAAILYEPSFVVVATWFSRHRARAMAILTFTGGLASVVFLPLTISLEERFGWRDALLILAVILAVTTILPHGLLLRHRPADHGLAADGERQPEPRPESSMPIADAVAHGDTTLRDAMHRADFWWIAGSFGLIWGCSMAILVHLIPYLQDLGYSAVFAATATGAIGLLKLPGRLIFAPLSERLSPVTMALLIFGTHALAVAVLAFATDSQALVWAFILLFSAGNGALTLMRASLVANVYGLTAYGGISGTIGLIVQGTMAAGPILVSVLVAAWGGYTPVFWLMFGLLVVASWGIARVLAGGPRGEPVRVL